MLHRHILIHYILYQRVETKLLHFSYISWLYQFHLYKTGIEYGCFLQNQLCFCNFVAFCNSDSQHTVCWQTRLICPGISLFSFGHVPENKNLQSFDRRMSLIHRDNQKRRMADYTTILRRDCVVFRQESLRSPEYYLRSAELISACFPDYLSAIKVYVASQCFMIRIFPKPAFRKTSVS